MTEKIKLTDLVPDPHNANKGTERGRGMLEKSLQELGAGRSLVVDRNNTVIAGNKSLEAAVEAGFEDAIVVETDGSKFVVVKRVDLDLSEDDKAKKLAIADNRVGEISLSWDAEVLAELSQDIDLSGLFTDNELEAIAARFEDEDQAIAPPEEFKEYGEDIETDYECPKCGYKWSGKANSSSHEDE